jgi:hypothetical protein
MNADDRAYLLLSKQIEHPAWGIIVQSNQFKIPPIGLNRIVAEAWRELKAAAHHAGISLGNCGVLTELQNIF